MSTFARFLLLWLLRRWGASPEALTEKAFGAEGRQEGSAPKRDVHVRVWDEDGELLTEVKVGTENTGV